MALTELYTGTETITTTEHSLTTDTAGPDTDTTVGEFEVWLDLNALANGDVFTFRGYEKVRSGDTQRKFVEFDFAHAQSTPIWVSPRFHLRHGWDFTLLKSAGTDRAINWSIRRKDDATVNALGAGTITAASIATDAIDADALADGAITAATFAAGAIDAAAIANGAIDAATFAAGAIDAAAIAADAVTEIQSGLATAAALDAVDNFIDTEVAAIKAKTDQLTFTVANQVDANIQSVNDVTVTGTGAAGDEWGP
jgi:hypothetical protein